MASAPGSSEEDMEKQDKFPDWFLWLAEKGFTSFIVLCLILFALIIGAGLYLDGRLETIEGHIKYVPPRSYQAPNFDDYQVTIESLDSLPLHGLFYVPVYSHIYYQNGAPYTLETTLSIRNVDPDQKLYLNTVDYFDTTGKLVKQYLDRTIKLDPLQTIEFLVERRDTSGGSGANFLVEWMADSEVDQPLVEAVMVGAAGTQGICFSRKGVEVSPPAK